MYDMYRNPVPPGLRQGEEAEAVLAVLAADADTHLKLNDLVARTGLPTGHVGRHLRTLERDRLACYGAGAWQATQRGTRHAEDFAGDLVPLAV